MATEETCYRLAPAVTARIVGSGLVLLAVVVFAASLLAATLSWPPDIVVVVLVVGIAAVLGGAGWLRGRTVVRLDAEGYEVHLVRGVGVGEGRWNDVTEAVAAHPRGVPALVLHRADGGTTTIPVGLLDAERDGFADEVTRRLEAAHRR